MPNQAPVSIFSISQFQKTFSASVGTPVVATIPEGYVLTVTGDSSAVGTVVQSGGPGSWVFGVGLSINMGPFTGSQKLTITCTAGTATASIQIADVTVPQIVVSSAAPSNSDGRPNGTIYIQTT
jgi:hypothetical protein